MAKRQSSKKKRRKRKRRRRKGLALGRGTKAVKAQPPPWPVVDNQVLRSVTRVLEDEGLGALTGGIQKEFEKGFAKYHGRRYALMTNSGTAALQLALAGCGVKAGDEVITTPYSWGASTGSIIHRNAIPVFADIDPETLCLDPTKIEERITDRTRAILAVHIFGMPADMPAIRKIAKERELAVIEDCSQATGAKIRDRRVGTWGNAGAFSLQASKNLSAGEGGAVITHERDIYEDAILEGTHPVRMWDDIRDEGRQRYIDSLSFNFRPHPLAAAIADSQLDKLEGWLKEKKRNFDRLFHRVGEIVEPHGAEFMRQHKGMVHGYHMVSLKVVHAELRELPRHIIAQALAKEGMPVGGYVQTPIPLRPRFRDLRFYGRGCPWTCRHATRLPDYSAGSWPVAERLCREGEIIIHGSHHVYDAELMDQYATAIEKLVEHLDKLRKHAEKQAEAGSDS